MADFALPARFEKPNPLAFAIGVGIGSFILVSFYHSGLSFEKLDRGLPALARLGAQMFPPSVERLPQVLNLLLQTFEMAVAGTLLGLVFSLPLAILAAPSLSPHPVCVWVVRGVVAL